MKERITQESFIEKWKDSLDYNLVEEFISDVNELLEIAFEEAYGIGFIEAKNKIADMVENLQVNVRNDHR